ncbi:MAG: hypothetical protein AB8G11_18615 [Saprospiraceae bacterium]
MNKPTKYKSQLSRLEGQLRINTTSKFLEIIYYLISLIVIIYTMYCLYNRQLSIIYNFLILTLIFFNKRITNFLIPTITIDNAAISSRTDYISLQDLKQLDVQIKFLENGAEILIKNIRFRLKNPSDVALLTDEIERYTRLKFYDSQSVDKYTEILTFKEQNNKIIDAESFITIDKNKQEIRIYDNFNSTNWFEIKTIENELKYDNLLQKKTETIAISNLIEIKIQLNKKAGIFKNRHQIKIIVQSLSDYITIFKSDYRQPNNEISTFRDIETIYQLLKKLPSLSQVKIEKEILQ